MNRMCVLLVVVMISVSQAFAARGRVKSVDGNVRSDVGTPLRGEHLGTTLWNTDRINSDEWYVALRDKYHMNTVRLLCYSEPLIRAGYKKDTVRSFLKVEQVLPLLDSAIAKTGRLGLYAIIDHHTIGDNDTNLAKAWWGVVASRYKDKTHVLFEVANEPVKMQARDYGVKDVEFQVTMHRFLRNLAPQTHIIHWSFMFAAPGRYNIVKQADGRIDYSNASIGWHGGKTSFPAVDSMKMLAPIIMTESSEGVPDSVSQERGAANYYWRVSQYESRGLSWVLLGCNGYHPGQRDFLPFMTISWRKDSPDLPPVR